METILSALLPVVAVVALGLGLRKWVLPDPAHWVGMEQITYYVLFPALLFVSAIRADMSRVSLLGTVGAMGLSLAVLCGGLLVVRPFLMRRHGIDGPAFTAVYQGTVRWNTYVALALADGLYGASGVAVAAVMLVCLIPAINVVVVAVIARYAGAEPPTAGRIVRQLVRNPLIVSCVAGAVINMLHVPVPTVALEVGNILGRASLATGLVVVGAGVGLKHLARPNAAVLYSLVLCLLVKPALALAFGLLLGLKGMELAVVIVICAVPSSPAGYVLARQMGGDAPLLAQILTLQLIVAGITLPLVIAAALAIGG
ncbi:AEC family transporter [Roseixanthobacter pseudopolyaromaticivorans]|uniref:AEC family transporter n=1 Tax=Xanthobacteraceae TaxID=335928 RepID=UPI00372635EC